MAQITLPEVPKLEGGRDGMRELEDFLRKLRSFVNLMPGSGGAAAAGSADATFITQKSEATLTHEQSLGSLTTGLLKNTVTAGTGVLSTATAGTDYQAALTGVAGQVGVFDAAHDITGSTRFTSSGNRATLGDPLVAHDGGRLILGSSYLDQSFGSSLDTLTVLGQDRLRFAVGSTAFYSLTVDNAGNTILTSIGTNDGTMDHPWTAIQQFLGPPTATPNVEAGAAAICVERTNHRFYWYENQGGAQGWHYVEEGAGGFQAVNLDIFGDGHDGAAAFDGTHAVTNCSRSGTTYTLLRDSYFTDVTFTNTATLKTAGYRLYINGTLTVNSTGVISCDGSNASGSSGGLGALTGTLNGGTTGGSGGTGDAGTSALTVAAPVYLYGGTGASGGSSGGSGLNLHGGGSGTAATADVSLDTRPRAWPAMTDGARFNASEPGYITLWAGGGGGGGGGGRGVAEAATGTGGGGGGGAGYVVLCATTISNAGAIRANGGNGANGTGEAGGGAGGGGGLVVVVYTALSGAGTITATGGTHGTHAASGSTDGGDGSAGRVIQVAVT